MQTRPTNQVTDFDPASVLLSIATSVRNDVNPDADDINHRMSYLRPTGTQKSVPSGERGSALQGRVESPVQIENVPQSQEANNLGKGKRKRTASSRAKEKGARILGDASNVNPAAGNSRNAGELQEGEPGPKRKCTYSSRAPDLVQLSVETPREPMDQKLQKAEEEIERLEGLLSSYINGDIIAHRQINGLERQLRAKTDECENMFEFYEKLLALYNNLETLHKELHTLYNKNAELKDRAVTVAEEGKKRVEYLTGTLARRDHEDRIARSTGNVVSLDEREEVTRDLMKLNDFSSRPERHQPV